MLPRSTSRAPAPLARLASRWRRARRPLAGTLPAPRRTPPTRSPPATSRGLGFDQCEAPSQSAMSAWIKKSPFRAAGIYISGQLPRLPRQTNLTATWVSNQLAAGWHLMPITLGPQASCSTRYPRYGKNIDPTINPSTANSYAAARAPGRAEAGKAVSRGAARSGSSPGSTLFYDLEALQHRGSTACTHSALWFLTAWTRQLHAARLRLGRTTPAPPPASGCSTTRGCTPTTRSRCPTRSGSPTGTARPTPAPRTSAATAGCPTAG